MMQNCPNQQQLLNWINMISFAIQDTQLYLDTHADDQEALEYFCHFHKLRLEALEEYARRFTPLTIDTVTCSEDQWKWVMDKWPWERGVC